MAIHKVLLTDRLGQEHGQVPPDGLSYERRLGGGGTGGVRIRLDNPVISGVNRDNLDTWATELLVLRDDQPRFNGPVVTLDSDAVAGHVTVSAASAVAWLSRRLILRDLPFLTVDQADILTALVEYAQDPIEKGPHADCRLLTLASPTGILRDRKYLGAERAQIADVVQQLADAGDGFDLTLELARVGTEVIRTLHAHYPLAGADVDGTLHLGQGGLTTLTVKRPGDTLATRVHYVGNGEGSDQITATAVSTEALESRYGVHEVPMSGTDIKEQATLQAQADGALNVRRPPLQVIGASYRVTDSTPYGLADLGDRVRVQADRGWLHVDERLRVIAEKVTVSPTGAETIDLTFNAALEAA